MGEVTPKMAEAVACSGAKKMLRVVLNACKYLTFFS
jgi:hypothetical protein